MSSLELRSVRPVEQTLPFHGSWQNAQEIQEELEFLPVQARPATRSLADPNELRYGRTAEEEMSKKDALIDHFLEENDNLENVIELSEHILQESAVEYFRAAVEEASRSKAMERTLMATAEPDSHGTLPEIDSRDTYRWCAHVALGGPLAYRRCGTGPTPSGPAPHTTTPTTIQCCAQHARAWTNGPRPIWGEAKRDGLHMGWVGAWRARAGCTKLCLGRCMGSGCVLTVVHLHALMLQADLRGHLPQALGNQDPEDAMLCGRMRVSAVMQSPGYA